MKELNKDKVQLLIDYLNRRIENRRHAAEQYEKSGNQELAMMASIQATENEITLAYLFGLMDNEE